MEGELQRLYGTLAPVYDAIYHDKDYQAEAERIRDLLHEAGIADASKVLEAACGTGSHLLHLKEHFQVEGFDKSPEMLALAKEKVAGARLFEADMTSFSVEPVDAVLCLFSSIGYIQTELEACASAFSRALKPSGCIIIEPFVAPEKFRPGILVMQTYEGEALKLCRSVIPQREGDLAILDFHWLILREGAKAAEHVAERHVMRLYREEEILEALARAGIDARFEQEGLMPDRGLIVGRKQATKNR